MMKEKIDQEIYLPEMLLLLDSEEDEGKIKPVLKCDIWTF